MAKSQNSVRKCHRCRVWIKPERFQDAAPTTWLCEKCSAEIGGETTMVVTTENLGKAGSLKKNEGGATPHFIRKDVGEKE